jgi:predicted secreted hydrolase
LRPQPVLPEGDHGFSRKGPDARSASRYYSLPHLVVTGVVEQGGKRQPVGGSAWLDREWSSSYLPQGAVGWDWTGLNFDDGGALMAFRIRRRTAPRCGAGAAIVRAMGR